MASSSGQAGRIINRGAASLRIHDHGEVVAITDLEIPEGSARGVAVDLGAEVMRIAAGRPVWISVDEGNDRALKFFEAAGFKRRYYVMVKNDG